MRLQPVSEALKDGTRILVRHHIHAWDQRAFEWTISGETISECWFDVKDGVWRSWRGSYRTKTTESIEPLSWMHKPEDWQ